MARLRRARSGGSVGISVLALCYLVTFISVTLFAFLLFLIVSFVSCMV